MTTKGNDAVLLRLLAACAFCTSTLAMAQPAETAFPSGPVKLIVATSAGAGMDAAARLIGDKLSAAWGKPVVVQNRPGGAGAIAVNAFIASRDPNTLLVADMGLAAINGALYPKLGYNAQTDFKPITDLFYTSFYLVTRADQYASLEQFLSESKKAPGKLNYGSAGAGSGQRLSMELLKQASGAYVTYIPFRGNADAVTALVAGEVDIVSIGLPPVRAFLEGGRLKALATTSRARSASMPDVPTVEASAKLKSFEAETWVGVFAPNDMPEAVIAKIQADVAAAMRQDDVRKFYALNDYRTGGAPTPTFARKIASDRKKYANLIKAAGIKTE